MTKEDMMKLQTSREIIHNMLKYPDVVDEDVSRRQIELARKEHDENYSQAIGDYSYHEDPNDMIGR